ncbi:uncharacterized protein LOC121301691 isoform X1 [Polyodon spathula]|uniref:uncharacterized protein LOC121301691 isoform X1 n=1 Tax=Polyodon spathula TaxID=7913 RepID=UPI001B7EA007|nr:uncharacterized protein LOC121301691 isoform X1 [Polyodon spathula]
MKKRTNQIRSQQKSERAVREAVTEAASHNPFPVSGEKASVDATAAKRKEKRNNLDGTQTVSALCPKEGRQVVTKGFTIKPIVPAKKSDVLSVAKAMHREKFGERVKELFDPERDAALMAIQTGIYIGWRSPEYSWDCFRVGDASKCFCGHLLNEHKSYSDCSLSPDAGTGSQNRIQFHYDKIKNLCQPFIYKGEGGNANRFAKEKECMKNCSATPDLLYPDDRKTLCDMPSVTGSCYGRILMWYFNSTASTCRTFIYSGCHGNANRFSTRVECLEFCRGKSVRAIGNQAVEENPEESAVDEGLIVGIVGGCIFVVAVVAAIVVFVTQRKSHSKRRSTEVEMK